MKEIILNDVKYTVSDMKQAYNIFYYKLNTTWVWLPCSAVFFVGVIITCIRQGLNPYTSGLLLIFGLIFLYFLLGIHYWPISRFEKSKRASSIYTIKISDSGLDISTEYRSAHFEWEFVKIAYKGKHIYVLLDGNSEFILLPRRYFDSKEADDMLHEILKSKGNVKYKSHSMDR